MQISAEIETWLLNCPFRISGHVIESVQIVVVTAREGHISGRGEACGVPYRGDTAERMVAQIAEVAARHIDGLTRETAQMLLPAGGARNALDCALWDLEARQQGRPVWQLAGLPSPRALLTTFTVGADTPVTMANRARAYTGARAIKIKLIGDELDAARIRAVRDACPNAWLGVDANQGFTLERLRALLPELVAADVKLLEQPFPVGREADMNEFVSPVPTAADESVQTAADLPLLVGCFDVINIKLDKSGGLTHALHMAQTARQLGFQLMVGNMIGTSWAMASAYLVGQSCDFVDLDGPLLLSADRQPSVRYHDGYIDCPAAVWGAF